MSDGLVPLQMMMSGRSKSRSTQALLLLQLEGALLAECMRASGDKTLLMLADSSCTDGDQSPVRAPKKERLKSSFIFNVRIKIAPVFLLCIRIIAVKV